MKYGIVSDLTLWKNSTIPSSNEDRIKAKGARCNEY